MDINQLIEEAYKLQNQGKLDQAEKKNATSN